MNSVDQAIQTQLKNIQARTGKSLPELFELIRASGLSKYGEIREPGPGTKGRVKLGLYLKGVEGGARLIAQEPGGMCQYKVFLSQLSEVDAELVAWLRQTYDSAG